MAFGSALRSSNPVSSPDIKETGCDLQSTLPVRKHYKFCKPAGLSWTAGFQGRGPHFKKLFTQLCDMKVEKLIDLDTKGHKLIHNFNPHSTGVAACLNHGATSTAWALVT